MSVTLGKVIFWGGFAAFLAALLVVSIVRFVEEPSLHELIRSGIYVGCGIAWYALYRTLGSGSESARSTTLKRGSEAGER